MRITSTNPAQNYTPINSVAVASAKDIADAIQAAHVTKDRWAELSVNERAEQLAPLSQLLAEQSDELANMITAETGKPLREAHDEFESGQGYIDYCIQNGPISLQDQELFNDGATTGKAVFEPFGVAAVITPWNYPLEMPL